MHVLIVTNRSNRFGIDTLAGIDEEARHERWRLSIGDVDEPSAQVEADAVIGFGGGGRQAAAWMRSFAASAVPQVWLDRDIVIDEEEVGRCAARHFQDRGIAHGAVAQYTDNPVFPRRCAGFATAMGGEVPTFELRTVPWEEQAPAFAAWLRRLPTPVGIFAPNDHTARIVLLGCAAAGMEVPGRCAVVGADNDPWLCLSGLCPLSSVRMPHYAMGLAAVARLRRQLGGQPPGPKVTVRPGSVCARMSSDVLHCDDEAVTRALSWMRCNFAAPLRIDAVADAAGINRRTLERRFRAHLGRSLHDELRRTRILHAQELLTRDPGMPIAAVAAAVGLSQSSFAEAFATETGVSPGAWRSGRVG